MTKEPSEKEVLAQFNKSLAELQRRRELSDQAAEEEAKARSDAAGFLARKLDKLWGAFSDELAHGALFKLHRQMNTVIDQIQDMDPGYVAKFQNADNPYGVTAVKSDQGRFLSNTMLGSGQLGKASRFDAVLKRVIDTAKESGNPLRGIK